MAQPNLHETPEPIVRHFVVLGAGASFGARCDPSRALRPPQGKCFANYLRQWLEANNPGDWDHNEQICAQDPDDQELPYPGEAIEEPGTRRRLLKFLQCAAKPAGGHQVGFEVAMRQLWERCYNHSPQPSASRGSITACRLIVQLNQLIAWALTTGNECAFEEGTDLYDNLVSRLEGLSGIAVISLNYDVLFEEAVERKAGKNLVWYPGPRFGQQPRTLPVYKTPRFLQLVCDARFRAERIVGDRSGTSCSAGAWARRYL